MEPFVKLFQPDRYATWMQGKDSMPIDHTHPTPGTTPELQSWLQRRRKSRHTNKGYDWLTNDQPVAPFSCSLFPPRSTHSCLRSKRLRTTEEPVGLDGGPVLGSSKKGLGGSSGPKVRKAAVRSTCREEDKEKDPSSTHSHFSGRNL